MTGMVAPAWMHDQVTAEQYATWTEEQCAGIEILDGMVVVSPGASKTRPATDTARATSTPGSSRRPRLSRSTSTSGGSDCTSATPPTGQLPATRTA